MLSVKELTGTVTFRHLLRFSQKGNLFCLPCLLYVRSMHLHSKVLRQERIPMQVKYELAESFAIGAGYLPTLAEETLLHWKLRAQHDQLHQLSSSGVTKSSGIIDTLTTPFRDRKLYVYAH